MFTELEGRISFITRIPKTAKGKIKKQYFQPLTLLDLEFDYRPRTSLQRIKDVVSNRTPTSIIIYVRVWNGWMRLNMIMSTSTLSL